MDSSLMMRFTPLIETTPEPAPEVILTYDTSCLPPAIPTPEPTPTPPQDENEGLSLITIPPLEGEFLELEIGELNEPEQPEEPEERFEERMLIFAAGGLPLYSAKPDGSDVQLLTPNRPINEAVLSPDGRYIVFTSNNHIYIMRSNGDDMQPITTESNAYWGIGWMPEWDDSQHIIYSIGATNTTYWVHRDATLALETEHTELIEEGVNPKWNERNQLVIYSSNAQLYRGTWDSNLWELSDIQAISPAHIIVDFYDWARDWQDIVFTEVDYLGTVLELWWYHDDELHAIDLERPIRASSVMSAPDSNAIVFSPLFDNQYYINFDDGVQRLRLIGTGYVVDVTIEPSFFFNRYYRPYLSPDGSKIHYIGCYYLYGLGDYAKCYGSYMYEDGISSRIFENQAVDHFPVSQWDIFRLPVVSAPVLDIVCIGQSSVNFVINIRSLPDRDSASVEENFAIGSPVGIIKVHLGILGERGLYWDWYYVQYEDINPYVQNIESRGWIRRDVMGSIANCGDIPRYDDNGSEIPPPIYDYRLPPPPENAIWYDSTWVMLDNNGTLK